jgi:ligand-binding sensor domain-containing protein
MVKLHNKILFLLLLLYASTAMSAQYRWRNVLITDSLSPQNDISAIAFAKSGCMWVGTWKGIYKFVDGKWISDGLENNYIQTLIIDRNNNLLAGTWGNGIFVKNTSDNSWNVLNNMVSNVNCIYVDKENKIWIGDCYNGLLVLDGETHTKQKIDKLNIGDNTVTSVVSDFNGNVWIATYHGVSVYHRNVGSKTFNTSNSILPTRYIYSLC